MNSLIAIAPGAGLWPAPAASSLTRSKETIMKVYVYCLIAALMGTVVAWGQVDGVPRAQTEVNDGMEVLTRGPVHEAFAETVTFDPEPGIVTPKMPPAAIEELPPEQRPEGTNIATTINGIAKCEPTLLTATTMKRHGPHERLRHSNSGKAGTTDRSRTWRA
jgi:hypothetical protein